MTLPPLQKHLSFQKRYGFQRMGARFLTCCLACVLLVPDTHAADNKVLDEPKSLGTVTSSDLNAPSEANRPSTITEQPAEKKASLPTIDVPSLETQKEKILGQINTNDLNPIPNNEQTNPAPIKTNTAASSTLSDDKKSEEKIALKKPPQTQSSPLASKQQSQNVPQQLVIPVKEDPTQDILPRNEKVSFLKFLGTGNGVISLAGLSAHESKPDITEPLRIEEAVAFALKNNFEVLANQSRKKSSRWEKIGAYSEMLPSMEYTYSKGKEHSRPASFNDSTGNRAMESWHFRQDRAFSIRQPLVDLGIVADILKTTSAQSAADADARDSHETIAMETINVFLKLVQMRITIHLADQYKGYLQNLLTRMEARVDGGGATNADLDRIRSRITIADAGRLEALGTYAINLSEFRRLAKVTPAQFEIPDQLTPETPLNPLEALEMAVKNNPSYQSSLKKIDLAEADRNRSLSSIMPKVSFEYSNIHSDNAGGAAKGNPLDGLYPKQKDERLMLVARWAMNGGTSIAQGFAGTEKMREMSFRANEARARIEQGIMTGYDALGAARRRIEILSETLETDRRVVRDFEEQYTHGGRSLFDLLDAYERRHNTQMEAMRTLIGEAQAGYQIRRQIGNLSDALVKPAPLRDTAPAPIQSKKGA